LRDGRNDEVRVSSVLLYDLSTLCSIRRVCQKNADVATNSFKISRAVDAPSDSFLSSDFRATRFTQAESSHYTTMYNHHHQHHGASTSALSVTSTRCITTIGPPTSTTSPPNHVTVDVSPGSPRYHVTRATSTNMPSSAGIIVLVLGYCL
jgi:hypothetical protein